MHPLLVWLLVLVVIFSMGFGYTVMSRVLAGGIIEDVENITEVNQSTDAASVMDTNKGSFKFWPYFLLLAFILWGLFASG